MVALANEPQTCVLCRGENARVHFVPFDPVADWGIAIREAAQGAVGICFECFAARVKARARAAAIAELSTVDRLILERAELVGAQAGSM